MLLYSPPQHRDSSDENEDNDEHDGDEDAQYRDDHKLPHLCVEAQAAGVHHVQDAGALVQGPPPALVQALLPGRPVPALTPAHRGVQLMDTLDTLQPAIL